MSNETKQEQHVKKALVCRCGKAYSMMATLPEADNDSEIIEDFKKYESEGRTIKYLAKGEGEWHSMSDCVEELQKYKIACESINKENPMVVAENLEHLTRSYSELLEYAKHSEDYNFYKEILTKIQSK